MQAACLFAGAYEGRYGVFQGLPCLGPTWFKKAPLRACVGLVGVYVWWLTW